MVITLWCHGGAARHNDLSTMTARDVISWPGVVNDFTKMKCDCGKPVIWKMPSRATCSNGAYHWLLPNHWLSLITLPRHPNKGINARLYQVSCIHMTCINFWQLLFPTVTIWIWIWRLCFILNSTRRFCIIDAKLPLGYRFPRQIPCGPPKTNTPVLKRWIRHKQSLLT